MFWAKERVPVAVELLETMKITLIVPTAEQEYTDLQHVATLREATDTVQAVGDSGNVRRGSIQSSICIIAYVTAVRPSSSFCYA